MTVYAADDMNYRGSRALLHSASRANFHKDESTPGVSGRMSPMSLRSLRDAGDGGSDSGADIPDILMRRPRRTDGRADDRTDRPTSSGTADLGATSASAMDEIFAGARDDRVPQGPISPHGLQYADKDARAGGVKSPEPADDLRLQSRSPSTYQRSILSVKSKAQSMSSSYQTNATSLAALQAKAADDDEALEPLQEEDLEPGSFDLVAPATGDAGLYSLERRSELLFSKAHLQKIFDDSTLLNRFTSFLCNSRPASLPLLIYYLDALKAIKAIGYSNAIVEALEPLEGHDFSSPESVCARTVNEGLIRKADAAFEALARDDLPAYVTHVWIQTVSVSIKKRICGTLPPHLRDMSEGLAEVFCLTDPSRHDNPIVFASEEFHRTTQYGMGYVLGRNCRFLQGPKTNPFSVKRLRDKLKAGKEHYETFLNYRRDGSPFMNLLMVAPLYDSRGAVRYFIGAQVDVSGLAKDCVGLESLRRLVDDDEGKSKPGPDHDQVDGGGGEDGESKRSAKEQKQEEIRELCEMFNMQELETVRRHGGSMHRLHHGAHPTAEPVQQNWHKPRVLIQDEASELGGGDDVDVFGLSVGVGNGAGTGAFGGPGSADHGSSNGSTAAGPGGGSSGRLTGVYENYLLVRPYPNLKILFASPSLRVPGILQSPFMSKIGGSNRVREELTAALAEGHGVTARVRWVSKTSGEGRHRWIHCTPLLGGNGAIGVWMVVITDDDQEPAQRRNRDAPPVDPRHYGPRAERSNRTTTTAEYLANERAGRGRTNGTGFSNAVMTSPRPGSVGDFYTGGGGGTRSSSPYTLRIGDD